MTGSAPDVVYVLPDAMGGMMNIVRSLLAHRPPGGMDHHVVLTRNTLGIDTPFEGAFRADSVTRVHYALPVENLHAVLRRLRGALPPGGGVLVANDLLELALLHVHDPGRAVVQILHGDHHYYYDLAVRHQSVIDVFVAYSRAMYDGLRRCLPHRVEDVHYLPYGVPLPDRVRMPGPGPLRLVFSGRIEHGQKGVFDLPAIDAALIEAGVDVRWTVIGGGPDDAALRARWPASDRVAWRGVLAHEDVLAALPAHDVFVLPTRAEGFPVALVEAMAAGVVPVVSDIPSGVAEVVDPGVSGVRPRLGDVRGFAEAIAALAGDRARLEAMSRAARAAVADRFEARARSAAYDALFARWRELRRPRGTPAPLPYGSRLDRPWLPNRLVMTLRRASRRRAGKPV